MQSPEMPPREFTRLCDVFRALMSSLVSWLHRRSGPRSVSESNKINASKWLAKRAFWKHTHLLDTELSSDNPFRSEWEQKGIQMKEKGWVKGREMADYTPSFPPRFSFLPIFHKRSVALFNFAGSSTEITKLCGTQKQSVFSHRN